MLDYTLIPLVVGLVAGFLGFGGTAAGIAMVLFVVVMTPFLLPRLAGRGRA